MADPSSSVVVDSEGEMADGEGENADVREYSGIERGGEGMKIPSPRFFFVQGGIDGMTGPELLRLIQQQIQLDREWDGCFGEEDEEEDEDYSDIIYAYTGGWGEEELLEVFDLYDFPQIIQYFPNELHAIANGLGLSWIDFLRMMEAE